MSIFSRSRSFSSKRSQHSVLRGFSIAELIVSISIMVIIVTITLIRFSSFDSTIILKGLAFEVALSVREAQTSALSVLGRSGDFSTPYGVTFAPETQKYTLFTYNGGTRPNYGDATDVTNFAIGRNLQIQDVCEVSGGTENCGINRFDVSFERPEFEALFFAVDGTGANFSELANSGIEEGRIKLRSRDGGDTWRVSVNRLGQISVCNESNTVTCPP